MNERMAPPARACGCRVTTDLPIGRWVGRVTAEITYCATHSAAPAMKAALEAVMADFRAGVFSTDSMFKVQDALALATPDDARRGEGAAG